MTAVNLSLCRYHFANIAWKDGVRRLFDPWSRRFPADRPEERVRLEAAAALTARGIVPGSRLMIETGLTGNVKEKTLRTDLIAGDAAFKPFILVECKRPDVALNEDTVRQALIYNDVLKAPHIWLTNGYHDVFFSRGRAVSEPEWLKPLPAVTPGAAFWSRAGFLPADGAAPAWADWLSAWFMPAATHPVEWPLPGGGALVHYSRDAGPGWHTTVYASENGGLFWLVAEHQGDRLKAVYRFRLEAGGVPAAGEELTAKGTRERFQPESLTPAARPSLLSLSPAEAIAHYLS